MTNLSTTHPSEAEIAEFMRQRIENGDIAGEDIAVRLARYGLMQPDDFIAEMCERMELSSAEWPGHEQEKFQARCRINRKSDPSPR
jgi:hypothetical protein